MAPKRSSAQIWNGFINHVGVSPNIQKQCSVRVCIIPSDQNESPRDFRTRALSA